MTSIPKGSIILANVACKITLDPAVPPGWMPEEQLLVLATSRGAAEAHRI